MSVVSLAALPERSVRESETQDPDLLAKQEEPENAEQNQRKHQSRGISPALGKPEALIRHEDVSHADG